MQHRSGSRRFLQGVDEMNKRHMGSTIDDFLKQERIFEEAQAQAIKEVVAWPIAETERAAVRALPAPARLPN
jgi:hypothetical protein